jgi:hypothetical protein
VFEKKVLKDIFGPKKHGVAKAKVNVKVSLCLISKALCHENIWAGGGIAPPFLTLALDGGE